MNSLLILIYLYCGCHWVSTNVIWKRPRWTGLICNFIFWPIYLLISVISYSKVKSNHVIKEES